MLSDHIIAVIILLPPPTTTIYYWLVFIHYETSISSYCLCKIIVIICWLLSAVLEASSFDMSFDMICIFSLWYISCLCHNHYRRCLLCVLWILRVNTVSTPPSSIVQSFMRAWLLQPEVYSCVSSEIIWLYQACCVFDNGNYPARFESILQYNKSIIRVSSAAVRGSILLPFQQLTYSFCIVSSASVPRPTNFQSSAFPHSSEVSMIRMSSRLDMMGSSNSCKWIMLEQSNCYELVEWDVSYVISLPQPHCQYDPVFRSWLSSQPSLIRRYWSTNGLPTVLVQRSRLLAVDDTLCYLCRPIDQPPARQHYQSRAFS